MVTQGVILVGVAVTGTFDAHQLLTCQGFLFIGEKLGVQFGVQVFDIPLTP